MQLQQFLRYGEGEKKGHTAPGLQSKHQEKYQGPLGSLIFSSNMSCFIWSPPACYVPLSLPVRQPAPQLQGIHQCRPGSAQYLGAAKAEPEQRHEHWSLLEPPSLVAGQNLKAHGKL